jgi:hypothetical protein
MSSCGYVPVLAGASGMGWFWQKPRFFASESWSDLRLYKNRLFFGIYVLKYIKKA